MENYIEIKNVCRYQDVTVGEMHFHVKGECVSLMSMWRSHRGITVKGSMSMPRGRMMVKYQLRGLWLPALVLMPTPTHHIMVEPLKACGWEDFGPGIYVFRKGDILLDDDSRFQQLVRLLQDNGIDTAVIEEDMTVVHGNYLGDDSIREPLLGELMKNL